MVVEDVGFGCFRGGGVELEFGLGGLSSERDAFDLCKGELGTLVVRIAVREFGFGFFERLVEFCDELFFKFGILGVCGEVVLFFDVGRFAVF